MAVVESLELSPERRGKVDEKGVRTFTTTWHVRTDAANDGPQIAMDAVPVAIGDGYASGNDSFLAATLRSKDPQLIMPEDDRLNWIVTCEYSSAVESANPNQDPNPLKRVVRVIWNTVEYQKPLERAARLNDAGDAVVNPDEAVKNSAGDSYVPAYLVEDSHWTVAITKNLAAVPPWILLYRNAVNASAFTMDGVPIERRMARISGIQIGPAEFENDVWFRSVTVQLDLREASENPLGWDIQLQDKGRNHLVLVAGVEKKTPILVGNEYTQTDQFLDGLGHKLPDGYPEHYRNYRARRLLSFAPLAALLS